MNVLVVNCGSSSVKLRLVDSVSGACLWQNAAERLRGSTAHAEALQSLLKALEDRKIDCVGHRVVHGGALFSESVLIDDDVVRQIDSCSPLAPLHNPANLAGVRTARERLPNIPHVAVFDTAFHARIPGRALRYAIDATVSERYGIRRYGFHGTSHAIVAARAAEFLQRPLRSLRLITCHLGNGASVCAIEFGHSVDTSMGMTPLEGLVMGTRSGDVDPGVVLTLCRELGVDETDDLLNRKSGLLGLSGQSNDLRDLEQAAANGNEPARQAIGTFAHRVRKYIGAYAAVLGGVDAVVFTGGIGQNSAVMRGRILQRFEYLGMRVDDDKNVDARVDEKHPVFDVSAPSAGVKALVVATNEALQIARETEKLVCGAQKVQMPRPIPIAISARHAHLDRATMDALFGIGTELTVHREISQPGQFASNETVNVIGPRGRLDNVRVLGPLRRQTQVEISRTDEFRIGVDAPIRGSGQLLGSAPVTLEGPKGTVHLKEGLICARRHIHMTPDDAARYGVIDGDEVEVELTGGPRDLTFGDVLVRVKESYRLEMHIDTDEANAAELSRGAQGELVYTAPTTPTTASLRSRRVPLGT